MRNSMLGIVAGYWILALSVQGVPAAAPEAVRLKVRPSDLRQVRLLDGPCKDGLERKRPSDAAGASFGCM